MLSTLTISTYIIFESAFEDVFPLQGDIQDIKQKQRTFSLIETAGDDDTDT